MADSNSAKAIHLVDNIGIDSTHQDGSNDTMEVEDEAELMMKDSLEGVVSWRASPFHLLLYSICYTDLTKMSTALWILSVRK